jgi:peroxiredoxin
MVDMIDYTQAVIAPDFTAPDSEGKTIRLSDYRGKNNVVLVFNRGFF